MASTKNSNRRKRKYGNRGSATERNKKRRIQQAARRIAKLNARTDALVGTHVAVRIKDHLKPMVGTVEAVIRHGDDGYPEDAKRHTGAYLRVRTTIGDIKVSRHRAKVVK